MKENTLLTKLQDYIDIVEENRNKLINKTPNNALHSAILESQIKTFKAVIKDLKSIIKDAKHD